MRYAGAVSKQLSKLIHKPTISANRYNAKQVIGWQLVSNSNIDNRIAAAGSANDKQAMLLLHEKKCINQLM